VRQQHSAVLLTPLTLLFPGTSTLSSGHKTQRSFVVLLFRLSRLPEVPFAAAPIAASVCHLKRAWPLTCLIPLQ
jgi:hypothetical protein